MNLQFKSEEFICLVLSLEAIQTWLLTVGIAEGRIFIERLPGNTDHL